MTSKDIIIEELLEGAYIRKDFEGFETDYKVTHCLLRKYKPISVFEIGTCTGQGINVLYSALPEAWICSLDLDYEEMLKNPKEFPIGPNGEDRVGSAAKFPYAQFRADSKTFDYTQYPCQAYFIDGEHTEKGVFLDTEGVLKVHPKLIIWHDADLPEVRDGIDAAMIDYQSVNGYPYIIHYLNDCRIAFAVREPL